MILIAAVDKNFGIGKDNNLLIKIPKDLVFFKRKTWRSIVVMGRKTLESLPNGEPLPYRINVVLSRNKDLSYDNGVVVMNSIEELLEWGKEQEKEIYVIGGGEIYKELAPYCSKAYLTMIDKEFDADTYFPDIGKLGINLVDMSQKFDYNGITYMHTLWKKP